jgi:hypothetical protein
VTAILRYLTVSAIVVVLAAVLVAGWVAPAAGAGVWLAAGVAYLVQAVAFAVLMLARGSGLGWVGAWGGGTFLRLLAVLGATLWVAGSERASAVPILLSLVGFLFLLLMLEPVFFRPGMRSR